MILLIRKQWFLAALVMTVALAFGVPYPATVYAAGNFRNCLIVLVFLGMGITLPSEVLIRGLVKWKIHLYIQSYIFIFIPALVMVSLFLVGNSFSREIRIGIIALSVLPTTISTCSVFTLISRGDVTLTLFNASFSNLAGIVVSPLLLSFLLQETGHILPASVLVDIISGLALMMLLPLGVGQLIRWLGRDRAARQKEKIGIACNLMILMIVYLTLARSVASSSSQLDVSTYLLPVGYLILLHFLLIIIAVGLGRWLKFSGPETISVMYAAPQKTLAMGVPLLTLYFADAPQILGVALLPLLFYHPWELFIAGVLSSLPKVKSWGDSSG